MAIDGQWSSVVLLCPFEGADGSTTTTDVKEHVVTVAGNAQISTSQYPAGCSSSAKFDGNNDYLTISHADFAPGTGDFDIDFPLYKAGETTTGAGNAGTLIDFRTAEPSVAIALFVDGGSGSTGANKVYLYVNGANRIVGTTEIGAAFKRVTLSRVSGVTRLFIDGVQEGSSYTDANNYTQTVANIGGRFAATSGDYRSLNGYLGPIRITKHGRGHSTTFTPDSLPFPRPTISGTVYDYLAAPVAKTVLVYDRSTNEYVGGANSDPTTGQYTFYPPDFGEFKVERLDELADPYWNDVALAARLTGANGGTSFPVLVGPALSKTGTVTTTTTTPTTDPFGTGSSTLFTGAGSYLSTGANASMLPGTVYTISGWLYLSVLDATRDGIVFIGDTGSNANRTLIAVHPSGAVEFSAEQAGSVIVHSATSATGIITAGSWAHFAAVRNGALALLFVNGVVVLSAVASGTESTGNNFHLGAGRSGGAIRGMQGNLFDVQYTKRAVWLSNFTPPPAPFPVAPADGGSGENAAIYDRVIPG